MNDTQTWTLIIGLLTAVLMFDVFIVTVLLRVFHAELGRVEGVLTVKIDNLDRDVQRLVEHWLKQS